MKVNIYPILSSLHDNNFIESERNKLLESLASRTGYSFNVVPLNKLYEDCDLALILVESGGSENQFLKNIVKFKAPYILLTFGHNNSLAASLEILTYLRRNNLKGEVLHGDNEYIAKRIIELANKIAHPDRLGVIGKPSDWLISSNVDYKEVKERFNIELVDISTQELINEIKKHNEDLAPSMFKATFNYDELKKAYHIYLALLNLVNRYNLKGFTIRCFDLLDTVHSTACLALSLFNDEGIIGTCEGDIPSLLGMFFIRHLLHKPSFQANPSRIDVINNEIILAHCTIPLKMTKSYKFDTHFESKIGVGIKGEMDETDVNIFRISPTLDSFVCLSGKIKENLNELNLCRTQIKIKLNDDITYFLKRSLGNHHLIIYGDNKDKIREYLLNFGLKEVK